LFAHGGDDAPLTSGDVVAPALAAEAAFPFTPVTAKTAPTLRRLAALKPRTLAIMHGQSFTGDAAAPLEALARHYQAKFAAGI
ncbi:MAG TPA: hypothetical protein VMU42_06985, partial [Candidatus Sulfotelmatobacter sp.]|nr:hypothetical protein [Candidatus Sulfotelmatobacter sp.]